MIEKSRKMRGDPMSKWDIAKAISDFIKLVEEKGYYIANCSIAISRDLNISSRQVNYLIEFFNTFPQKELLHQQISWDKDKEILDVKDNRLQEKIIQKILQGNLKTREDVRKYKKQYLLQRMQRSR
jgi:hypothetical protein